MTNGNELVYGEFDCGGERVVRLEDVEDDDAWIRSSVTIPIER